MLGNDVTLGYGEDGLASGTIDITLRGTAGQSLGAFMPGGITLRLLGDANDYVGKGLSGGQIVIKPAEGSVYAPERNVIAGNVIGYGATSGTMFISGVVGERFLVRNSGATAVVEGAGDHALEYMTGGLAVILGETGRNVAAGMSGGTAYIYRLRSERVNREALSSGEIELSPLDSSGREIVRDLLVRHLEETDSPLAARLIELGDTALDDFVMLTPRDYKAVLNTRDEALAQGLDPDGEEVWSRILEVTGG
jgi:glutamate synthase (NADPH/NADH) large chain